MESALADAVESARTKVAEALESGDYPTALDALASLRQPIDELFEATMIMDEDMTIRANRMKLLNAFVGVFADVADFGMLSSR